jgi:hypothetical protein
VEVREGRGLAPESGYAANAWGLHDTIGNVWEWINDAYAGPHQAHLNGDTAAIAAPSHAHDQPFIIEGGSFLCSPDFCVRYRASAREQQEADLATAHMGVLRGALLAGIALPGFATALPASIRIGTLAGPQAMLPAQARLLAAARGWWTCDRAEAASMPTWCAARSTPRSGRTA